MSRTASTIHPEKAGSRLAAIAPFSALPEGALGELEVQARALSYAKNQLLFTQDDPAQYFYIITSGWVKIFRETLDGNEVILDVLPSGHVFGETALFVGNNYPFAAEMAESGTLMSYPLSLLKRYITQHGSFTSAMLRHLSTKTLMQGREIEHRTVMKAPQRIACFLLRLCQGTEAGPAAIDLPYDKGLLSARLGMQPETFSRALAKLEQETGITVQGAHVTIPNVARLVTYTCTACSNVFPCDDHEAVKPL